MTRKTLPGRKMTLASKGGAASVPVMLESLKGDPGLSGNGSGKKVFHAMSRCNYFCIASDEPGGEFVMTESGGSHPSPSFLMVGMRGVILGPPGGDRFKTSAEIRSTFKAVEYMEGEGPSGFYIDVDDLWLPASLLVSAASGQKQRTGTVYRLSQELFRLAYSHRRGSIGDDAYLKECLRYEGTVEPSPEESESFRQWWKEELEISRGKYYEAKAKGLTLRRREELTPGKG
ncbi:hypothetical protein EPN96_00965 [bacterium]|nr:MAG: hypothetical protein EPN96_00965 [bacterium]